MTLGLAARSRVETGAEGVQNSSRSLSVGGTVLGDGHTYPPFILSSVCRPPLPTTVHYGPLDTPNSLDGRNNAKGGMKNSKPREKSAINVTRRYSRQKERELKLHRPANPR